MRDAVDFSDARPGAALLAGLDLDAIGYVGRSRPERRYLDELERAGVLWTFTFETNPNRSQEGYQAGVYDAQFFDQRASEVGYPADAPALVVVSDGTAAYPSSGGERIMDYGEGWARTTARPLESYGNRYATDAFNLGVARVDPARLLRPDGGWLPIPWGGNPDRDLMGQDANTTSPVPGTDLNRVWFDYHTPAPLPAAPIGLEDDDDMRVIRENKDDGSHQFYLTGNGRLSEIDDLYALGLLFGDAEWFKEAPRGLPQLVVGTLSLFALRAKLGLALVA